KNEHRPPILQPWQKTADQYVGKRTIRHLDDDMSAFDRRGRGGGLEIPKDKKFVDQPPGEIYLITVRKERDETKPDDLDASDRPIRASRITQARVAIAKGRKTDNLEFDMESELRTLAGNLGALMFQAFQKNNIRGVKKQFAELDKEVANSKPF